MNTWDNLWRRIDWPSVSTWFDETMGFGYAVNKFLGYKCYL